MAEIPCVLVLLPIWLILMVWQVRFYWVVVPAAVDNWAERAGYRLLVKQRRNFFRGPFFWMTSNVQSVYRIEVQDRQGLRRSGWLRTGTYWWPSTEPIDVRWDEPQSPVPDPDDDPTAGKPLMWDRDLDA